MANQWGRETTFQPRQRSAGLIIIVAILSLVLGFGGGYAAFRYLEPEMLAEPDASAAVDPDTSAAADAANAEISRLTEALAQASMELEQARAAEAARSAEVDELKAQTARQAADLDAMAERIAALSSEAQPSSDDGTAALEALSQERDVIARERNALSADNQALASDLAAVEADRDALRQEAADAQARLEDELARFSNQVVPELTAERDQLQRQVSLLLADQAALAARLKAADQGSAEDARRMAELETRLADTEGALSAAQEALAESEAARTAVPATPEPEPQPDAAEPATAAEPSTAARDAPALSPRDPDDVAAALQSAPGIAALSGADRRALAERLAGGECVTTALEAVFDRVPILTLRNLIRDLNSGC